MTILAGDILLLESDTMSDADEGGGRITANVIVDGVSNNIFDDISTLDRVYGAVHMRKTYAAVKTQTVDPYFGAHAIISKLPGDTKIGVNLFNTADWFDRRPAAQTRVENYLAQGAVYAGFLWATQFTGSRVVTLFQGESAPIPGVGDVLMLISSTDTQYIRIANLSESVQEFTDASGVFKRRIVQLEISDTLKADFVGAQISRLDTITPDAVIFHTIVANAARYYSARPLAQFGATGDFSVKVDSIYSQLVPSSQSEVAILDQNAGNSAAPLIDAAQGTVDLVTSMQFASNVSVYIGSPVLPGTLSIPVTGGTIVDNAGQIKIGTTTLGTINYAEGTLVFGASSPTYDGAKTITFRPAAAPIRLANTASLAVTAANRGYVWTININPPPKPGALRVSYRALNQWYELVDNAAGGLLGTQSGIGTGTVNYVTGSVSVTLGVLPDADSEIIFAWGNNADFINRSDIPPGKMKVTKVLTNAGVLPETLVISWNDGAARSITSDALGVLSGDGTGQFNAATNTVEFSPNTLPLGGTTFTFDYDYGTAATITDTFDNVSPDGSDNVVLPLSQVPAAGTVYVIFPTYYESQRNLETVALEAETVYMKDDGIGGFGANPGSVNYAGQSITIPNAQTRGRSSKTAEYDDLPVVIPTTRWVIGAIA